MDQISFSPLLSFCHIFSLGLDRDRILNPLLLPLLVVGLSLGRGGLLTLPCCFLPALPSSPPLPCACMPQLWHVLMAVISLSMASWACVSLGHVYPSSVHTTHTPHTTHTRMHAPFPSPTHTTLPPFPPFVDRGGRQDFCTSSSSDRSGVLSTLPMAIFCPHGRACLARTTHTMLPFCPFLTCHVWHGGGVVGCLSLMPALPPSSLLPP